MHFQPKMELGAGRIRGFEALVRWAHPNLGIVLPSEFIPMAEQSGDIEQLTLWTLNETLRLASRGKWPELGLQVAVNLSARNLQDARLPEQILQALETWDFPPRCLMLEITESAVMSDFAGAIAILNRLREIGVQLSVDDFGAGYTSLTFLRELPLQELKIDRAFVTNIHNRERDLAIVQSTVQLGHNLGMSVIGEGVEDLAALQTLNRIGCDGAQGYAIAQPMKPEKIASWLETQSVGFQ
jgi:EAL domain-containing protein (putative c-di-GMP-specific phosphodiesterase class I)